MDQIVSLSRRVSGLCSTKRVGLERGPLLFHALRDRNRLRLHPRHEILIRRRPNDRIELRSVVSDEAYPLDDDVIDEPAVAPPVHSVVDGNLRTLLGDDLGAHGRLLTLDRLAGVADLLRRTARAWTRTSAP